MKIIVYAISKNEEQFVDRFMQTAKEADKVFVLDTGSTDLTVKKLQLHGAIVKSKIVEPWRFDVARNYSLSMVDADADLCVCVDIDEVLEEGWRKKLEEQYQPKTKQVRYKYVWSHLADGSDGHTFLADKIHVRQGFIWVNPVHEVLRYVGKDYLNQIIEIRVDHYPDNKKSRSSYLPLLELAVREQPKNDRNMHYLGREYMYYGMYQKAIETFEKHLSLDGAVWTYERSASFRYMGVCYSALNEHKKAEEYFLKAIAEAPDIREPYFYLAEFYFENFNYIGTLYMCKKALSIKNRELNYITEPRCYGELLYDLASISCYHLGMYKLAEYYVDLAIKKKPSDDRLIKNKRLILEKASK